MTIDTSTIEGFDGMTAEEKLDAVLQLQFPDAPDMSKFVSKETFDKKASEAASFSKQLKELTEKNDSTKTEAEKELAKVKDQLAEMQKDKTVSDFTAKYLALGYDKDLAADTARAMAEGDMETVFKNGEKHREALEKKIKEDLMNRTPKPDGAGGDNKGEDAAVAKARAIAKARQGGGQTYNDIMKNYK